MKFLIAGLGNIGAEYEHTRHNVGFDILDPMAKASEAVWQSVRHAHLATLGHKGRQLILIKPTTYMNLSGKAVAYWMQQEKIPLERILVVTDDLSLPLGKIRLRKAGSDGGHNGLKSINETLGTQNYARLRVGIGNNFSQGRQVDYVLGKWTEEEEKLLAEVLPRCAEAIKSFCTLGPDKTMTLFNR